jgi:hypothetical protein
MIDETVAKVQVQVSAFTNETTGSRFFAFNRGDHFTFAGTYVVEIDDAEYGTPEGWSKVDEKLYEIGNREGADANGQVWPFFVRSLSVGDVLLIGRVGSVLGWSEPQDLHSDLVAHVVENFGFRAERVVLSVDDRGICLS